MCICLVDPLTESIFFSFSFREHLRDALIASAVLHMLSFLWCLLPPENIFSSRKALL